MIDIHQVINNILKFFHFFFQGIFFIFEVIFDFVKSFSSSINISSGDSGFGILEIIGLLNQGIILFSVLGVIDFSWSIIIFVISNFIGFSSLVSLFIEFFNSASISGSFNHIIVLSGSAVQEQNIRNNLLLVDGLLFNFLDIVFNGSKISKSNVSLGFLDDSSLFFNILRREFMVINLNIK